MFTPIRAEDAVNFFLSIDEGEEDGITNLKLQKLLYYAQGFYAALHPGEALFPERIEAWDHGPVVIPTYFDFRQYGKLPIGKPGTFDASNIAPEAREILQTVYEVYGQYTAWKLRDLTHGEAPYTKVGRNDEITVDSLREFFSKLVEAGRHGEAVDGEPVWPTNRLRFQRRQEISQRMQPHRSRLKDLARRVDPATDPWLGDDED